MAFEDVRVWWKSLRASPSVLEAASDRELNLQIKLGGNPAIRQAWEMFQSAGYGFLYGHQPAVRKVVDYIAANISEISLKCYERKSDTERIEKGDHPAAEVLRDPNPWTSGKQFIFEAFADFLVYNNSYALKIQPTAGARRYLLCVPPANVTVLGQGIADIAGYRITRLDGSWFIVGPEDMIHWRGYNASDRRMGISKLETLRQELSEAEASRRANVDLMESGLQQRGYIKRPIEAPDWNQRGGRDRFVTHFREAMQRADRGYPILEEGMSIESLGVSPRDAQMLEARRLFDDEVASQYGMVHCPPQSSEERDQFYADVIPPLTSMFCDVLRVQLLQAEYAEDNYYLEFDLDQKRITDNRLTALVSAAGSPIMTRREARALIDLPPLEGQDDDKLVTPANVIVGGKPSPQAMPIQDPNKPSQDGSYRELPPGEKKPLPPGGNEENLTKTLGAGDAGVKNWVDEHGGLPKYIKRIKKHLEEHGFTEGHAIAVAVNAAKKMCETGDTNFPGIQHVNAGSRGEACAAVAEWERMKAAAGLGKGFNPAQARDAFGKWTDEIFGLDSTPDLPGFGTPAGSDLDNKHLYHVTQLDHLPSIQQNGLQPQQQAVLDLEPVPGLPAPITPFSTRASSATYLHDAKSGYADSSGVHLRIKQKDLPPMEADPLHPDAWEIHERIPPSALEVFKDGKWVPLKSIKLKALNGVEVEIAGVMTSLLTRQEAGLSRTGEFDMKRWNRELTSDLGEIFVGAPEEDLKALANKINTATLMSVANDENGYAFERLKGDVREWAVRRSLTH